MKPAEMPKRPKQVDAMVIPQCGIQISTGVYSIPGEFGLVRIFEISRHMHPLDYTTIRFRRYDGSESAARVPNDTQTRVERIVMP